MFGQLPSFIRKLAISLWVPLIWKTAAYRIRQSFLLWFTVRIRFVHPFQQGCAKLASTPRQADYSPSGSMVL
jgi:hypothetical protein